MADSYAPMPRVYRVVVLLFAMLCIARFATGAAQGANDAEAGKTVIALIAGIVCCWLYVRTSDDAARSASPREETSNG